MNNIMDKQEIQFAIVTKGNIVTTVGRSQVLQPKVNFKGGSVKWIDDELYRKKQDSQK